MKLHPTKRAAITAGQLHEKILQIRQLMEAQAQDQAANVEHALEGDADFLEALRVYASRLHW